MDQPTTIRMHKSITVARYSYRESVRRLVMSPPIRVPGVVEGTPGNWVRVWKEEHSEAGAAEPGPVEWAKYKA